MTDFLQIVSHQKKRYPLMEPQDYVKLAFQSAMGPEHMIMDEQSATDSIRWEWESVPDQSIRCHREAIGNGICRFHLLKQEYSADAAAVLGKLFMLTAANCQGSRTLLREHLQMLHAIPVTGMNAWLAGYEQQGCPSVHHSETFRNAYHPHYRILQESLANYFPVLTALHRLTREAQSVCLSLQGYDASDRAFLMPILQQILPATWHLSTTLLPAKHCIAVTPEKADESACQSGKLGFEQAFTVDQTHAIQLTSIN